MGFQRQIYASETFLRAARQMELFDHFDRADALFGWNTLEGDADGDVSRVTDQPNGLVRVRAAVSANQEAYLFSDELFKFRGESPMEFIVGLNLYQEAVNGAALVFGFMDNIIADTIVDGGLNLRSSWTGALFFKPYNTNVIEARTVSTGNGAWTTEATDAIFSATSGSSIQRQFAIRVDPKSQSLFEVSYYMDGEAVDGGIGDGLIPVRSRTGLHNRPIKHTVRFDPGAELALVIGIKNVLVANESYSYVDYVGGIQGI